jgi:hypothetical protein
MRGNGDGRGQFSGNGHTAGSGPVLDDLMHLRAEIDRIRSLKTQGLNPAELDFELAKLAKRSGIWIRKLRHWFEQPANGAVPGSVAEINALVDGISDKPELVVETANLPAAADAVRDLLAAAGGVFEWGVPAKVVSSSDGALPQIVPMTVEDVVNKVHPLRQPIKFTPGGQRAPITLPDPSSREVVPPQERRMDAAAARRHHNGAIAPK